MQLCSLSFHSLLEFVPSSVWQSQHAFFGLAWLTLLLAAMMNCINSELLINSNYTMAGKLHGINGVICENQWRNI